MICFSFHRKNKGFKKHIHSEDLGAVKAWILYKEEVENKQESSVDPCFSVTINFKH